MKLTQTGRRQIQSVLIAVGVLASVVQGAGEPEGLRIRALIDGADRVKVKAGELWYEHETCSLPGDWQERDEPTFVNGQEWRPSWDGKTSSRFQSTEPLLRLGPGKRVCVRRVHVRGRAFVLEQPSEKNGYAVTIYLDDHLPPGADWYEILVTVEERPPESKAACEGYAWQQTAEYRPPHFDSFFPDDVEGGKQLDALFPKLMHDSRPDEEILSIVRNGLRRTTRNRKYVLSAIGNRYIWGKRPQHPDAIEIMYYAADPSDKYGTRHYAVYFGLSVIRPPKPPAVLRTLAEICMTGGDVGRVTWGCKTQLHELRRYVEPYLHDRHPEVRERAAALDRHFKGESKFGDWQRKKNAEKAKGEFGDRLPEFKNTLLSGDSRARKKVISLIRSNYAITSLMDDSFIEAWVACASDPDPGVRRDVARIAGNRWIWGQKDQKREAIDLMLELSHDEDRSVRYNAVYFGLSTVASKDKAVIDRLLQIAMDDREPNMYRRICWGLKRNRRQAAQILEAYMDEHKDDPKSALAAFQIYGDITGKAPRVPNASRNWRPRPPR